MCGIFGVVRPRGVSEEDRAAFARLSSQLVHRGPDGFGQLEHHGVLAGMHRLSIIDIEHGWPPFRSGNGSVAALANGEIYNSPELVRGLQAKGHKLRSHSDLEVIPHLYEDLGSDYVSRLRGMFAICVLDTRLGTVLLTRDRIGEKPLFYCLVNGAIWFSSEMSALVRAQIVPSELDRSLLSSYLTYGYVPEPKTIISNIMRIPSGHHLRINVNDGKVEILEYWNAINFVGDDTPSVDLLESIVNEAVLLNVRSDVPVAVALSGGLDSSLVSALAHRANDDVQAISVGYAERAAGDESEVARSFAEYLGMPFHRVEISIADASRSFEQVCQRRDEPISDLAGPGYDALAQTARELGFPVLLNGQGGDELFWGYPWVLRLAKHASQVTSGGATNRIEYIPMRKGSFVQWWDDLGGLRTRSVLKEFASRNCSDSIIPLYRLQVGHNLLKRQISQVLPGQSIGGVLNFPLNNPSLNWSLFALGTIDTYLKSNGLAQMDRLTMAHSVEGRTPLVDYRLVEYALSTMSNNMVLQQPPKALMRELAARVLPAHIVDRPKRGFTPPVREWIRGIWRTQGASLKSPFLAEIDAFDQVQLLQTLQSPIKRSGRVNQLSLRLLTLELWLRGM